MYEEKGQLMLAALDRAGLKYFAPQGPYFVMGDYSEVFNGSPLEFTRYLTREIGVACIPPETFYSRDPAHIGHGNVGFVVVKIHELLRPGRERLAEFSLTIYHARSIAPQLHINIQLSSP